MHQDDRAALGGATEIDPVHRAAEIGEVSGAAPGFGERLRREVFVLFRALHRRLFLCLC